MHAMIATVKPENVSFSVNGINDQLRELSIMEIDMVSGGFDAETFAYGVGFGLIGAAAVAAAPLIGTATLLGAAASFGVGASGGVLVFGGGSLIALSFAER